MHQTEHQSNSVRTRAGVRKQLVQAEWKSLAAEPKQSEGRCMAQSRAGAASFGSNDPAQPSKASSQAASGRCYILTSLNPVTASNLNTNNQTHPNILIPPLFLLSLPYSPLTARSIVLHTPIRRPFIYSSHPPQTFRDIYAQPEMPLRGFAKLH
ncbi:hypothetical protein BT63DRAFT_122107 [Microthyrium microscopicum]|uniref:Uncharacterized protein n=1 Tax=Microthyrium microscopicum TaxID=703497 RepID=A0A6A6TU28_9PEZI|nr:hypothetical protein BT63DRAFT_122107 [Microthyrium microscopicum]